MQEEEEPMTVHMSDGDGAGDMAQKVLAKTNVAELCLLAGSDHVSSSSEGCDR